MRHVFALISLVLFAAVGVLSIWWPPVLWSLVLLVPLFLIGLGDIHQERRAVRRNFPVIGNMRYLMEMVRPELNQYFIESNTDGRPFSRNFRSIVYQRAKRELSTLPFGTQRDVYQVGYEWMNHSMYPKEPAHEPPRVEVGGPDCKKPYSASLLNISAMSFGALSKNAIEALSGGAAKGHFYHNTGEGGVSPYHLRPGGDLVWQVGTAYFGCREPDGSFSRERFRDVASQESVRMIELKLSQGAKPGKGGILPAAKISREIAETRGVPVGEDVISPPYHREFSSPRGLLEFIAELRELSGGKPVGFKLCVGNPEEFVGICKAMLTTGIAPDFISVDGGEGGTGAAPLEFSNSVGTPLADGLAFVHNTLIGFELRDAIRIVASGRLITGFHLVRALAQGADMCASARGMMMALGCIQALRCNSNACPVGVATQDPHLVGGLVVEDKTRRVYNFHRETVHSMLQLVGAAGLESPDELRPWHILRRVSATEVRNYAEIFDSVEPGALLREPVPSAYERAMLVSSAEAF
jgi:glutamate synthase domain-containing protein 2